MNNESLPPPVAASFPATDYPRTTTTDFLPRCSPMLRSFYEYWDAKRAGRPMPARADLDPIEMKPWLPGIILVDVLEGRSRLVYRLVGSEIAALHPKDVTGRSVEDGFFGLSLEAVLENYRLVISGRTLVYDWSPTPSVSGLARHSETLLLPLSGDGHNVDKVIVYLQMTRL